MKPFLKYLHSLREERRAVAALALVLGISLYAGLEADRLYAQPKADQKTEATQGEEGKVPGAASKQVAAKTGTPEERPRSGVIDLFMAGGSWMWPLLLCSVISLAVIVERLFFFYGYGRLTNNSFQQSLSDSLAADGLSGARSFLAEKKENLAIANILDEGLGISIEPETFSRGVERAAASTISRSERFLPVLAAISTIAPLIGFLGTVAGMILAFDAIANADSVNAKVVAGGIKVALLTTAAGLIVAIPAMTFLQFFSGKVNGFATEVEEAANSIYKTLLRGSR